MMFWDFSAPFYDGAEHTNTAYSKMLDLMRDLTPQTRQFLKPLRVLVLSAWRSPKKPKACCVQTFRRKY